MVNVMIIDAFTAAGVFWAVLVMVAMLYAANRKDA